MTHTIELTNDEIKTLKTILGAERSNLVKKSSKNISLLSQINNTMVKLVGAECNTKMNHKKILVSYLNK